MTLNKKLFPKASIWLAKKRYAQWIINNNGVRLLMNWKLKDLMLFVVVSLHDFVRL